MRYLLFAFCMLFAFSSEAKQPVLSEKAMKNPPPRIIRTCCSFGSEVGVMGLPGVKISDITSVAALGPHQYLGNELEGNGIIYTRRGGFIDMGHLRDQADWTAYLFSHIMKHKERGVIVQKLGYEGGAKTLTVLISEEMSAEDIMLLAGKVAYDLSVWHEIATWFGASYIPMLPERFSAFSVEDAYSNLLGVHLGIAALKSELPYEEAMTQLIYQTLDSLDAVISQQDTHDAMEGVHNIWWTRNRSLPSKKILLYRQLDIYPEVSPLLVPGWESGSVVSPLSVPLYTCSNDASLNQYYHLEFNLNIRFPYRELFPVRKGRWVTPDDFGMLIEKVGEQLADAEIKKQKLEERKQKIVERKAARRSQQLERKAKQAR
ncbi:MAG: hypothetical protein ACI9VN_002814 [Patescibacteria group bacterium]|jgi:hypothetical protein